jgi:hypothetical protein
MNADYCKNLKKCPIYNGILKNKDFSINAYKKLFCEVGKSGWENCKRYLVKEKTGQCPADLLPNEPQDINEIIREMNLSKNI